MSDEEVRVKNRDIPKLQRVYALMQEIRRTEERREWERVRMNNITSHLSWTHGGGAKGGLEESFARISEMEEKHEAEVRTYAAELRRAEAILNGIENERMRVFVLMMYVENMCEEEVRAELGLSEAGMKMARRCVEKAADMKSVKWHERYIWEG